MGFAFSLDDLIDCGQYDGMNTGWNPINSLVTQDYIQYGIEKERKKLSEKIDMFTGAVQKDDIETVKRTRKEIKLEITELESLRYHYRVAEKNILRIKNKHCMKSVVVMDIIDGLLEFYTGFCDSIAELQEEIKENTGIKIAAEPKELDENVVKSEIAKAIFDIIDGGISNGLPLSREMFRNIVKDLENILGILEYDNRKVKKQEVEQYFINKCNKKIGMVVCQNCKHSLLADIPYCFNCFDGRYS